MHGARLVLEPPERRLEVGRLPSSRRRPTVATRSTRAGATSRPRAEATPADGGQITRGEAELPRDSTGVHRARAAGGEQRIARGSWPCSAMCTRAALAMFSLTMSWMPHASSVADRPTRPASRSTAACGGRAGRAHLAAHEIVGVEIAEQEVGVGDGRLACRPARRRPGPGSEPALAGPTFSKPISSTWAMLPPPAPISISSMVGDADGQAAALDEALLARGLEAVRGQRLAAVDERELGGGAAHVEGEEIAAAVRRAEEGGGERARGGARFEQRDGRALGLVDVGEPAAREHEQQRRGDAERGELSGQHARGSSARAA